MTFAELSAATTLEALRAAFKKLVLKHHPDRGGDIETMKLLNAAYTAQTKRIISGESARSERETGKAWSERKTQHYTDLSEKLRATLEKLMVIPEIEVEQIGLWFWVDGCDEPARKGEVKPDLEVQLREIGLRYSYGKRRWYFAGVPTSGRGKASTAKMRFDHGSRKVKGKGSRGPRLEEAA